MQTPHMTKQWPVNLTYTNEIRNPKNNTYFILILRKKREFLRKHANGKGELFRNIFGENADFLDIFLETFAF
jgi:hypothetical protein